MKEISKKSDKDILKDIRDKKAELRQFRFDLSGSKTRNVKLGKNLKKDIARLLTELNSRKA